MLGLGDYESSDEETSPSYSSETAHQLPVQTVQTQEEPGPINTGPAIQIAPDHRSESTPTQLPPPEAPSPAPATVTDGPVVGPAILEPQHGTPSLGDVGNLSPYSRSRSSRRELTMPAVPSFDIPPSPPGTPSPATNAKIAHFLSLKRDGVHFNEKLAKSSSLKNPSLLFNLSQHAGIDEEAQYASSLPDSLSQITIPRWGYKEELNRAQQNLKTARAAEGVQGKPRENLDFVSGGQLASGLSNASTPEAQYKAKVNERVKVGLARDENPAKKVRR